MAAFASLGTHPQARGVSGLYTSLRSLGARAPESLSDTEKALGEAGEAFCSAEVEFNKDAGKITPPVRNFLGLEDMQAGSGVSWAPGII